MSAARTHEYRQFPETRGERIVLACCLAMPFAGVIAIIVASIAAASVAAAASFVVYLTLAVYIVRFLSTNPSQGTLHLLDDSQQCRGCGVPFRPIRANQIYCGRACRDDAAATRRKNRLEALSRPDPSPGAGGRSL